jgi:hypothetical protein
MFALGALALLMGVGLPLAAWLTSVRGEQLMAGLVPSVALTLIGAVMLRGRRPWKREEGVPARSFLQPGERAAATSTDE